MISDKNIISELNDHGFEIISSAKADAENYMIKTAETPEKFFSDAPLRILEAVRFSSVSGFDLEDKTAVSAVNMRKMLSSIPAEQISAELLKIIYGKNVVGAMLKYKDIIGQIIPEIIACFGFEQHSKYHKYNVYEHIVRAVNAVPLDLENSELLRTVMLFHDIGKPDMFTLDEKGFGHFKGHAEVSAVKARKIMRRLKFDSKTTDTVCEIIAHHSDKIISCEQIKKLLSQIGAESFFLLIEAKKADNTAKQEFVLAENDDLYKAAELAGRIIKEVKL